MVVFFIAGCTGNDKEWACGNADPQRVTTNIAGETLFKANCASCHRVDKDFSGPALKGALERWGGDKKAMYEFIKNSSESKGEYADSLKKKWAPTYMTAFPTLSNAEIDSIMQYVENRKTTY